MWAARNDCTATVRVLMRYRRIDRASVDNDQRNAISWASAGGHLETLLMLLKFNCPGVDVKDVWGWAPLAWAIQNNSPRTVETLVSNRFVDVEQKDDSGRSALSWAVEYGHLEVVRTLLQADADPSSTDEAGMTPLATAEKFGRTEISEEILYYIRKRSGRGLELAEGAGGNSTGEA